MNMEKTFMDAVYELTQAVEVLALKVDELDHHNQRLYKQNRELIELLQAQFGSKKGAADETQG